jgi:hypothetical protein
MTRIDKILMSIIVATALTIVTAILIFASPRDRAIRNQMELVRLMARAHPDLTAVPIERVILGDGTALVPEREQIVVGYVLRAHVQSSTFTLEAQPVKVGKTGLFSYFRDDAGVIRFEMGEKRASTGSRPLVQPLPDEPR